MKESEVSSITESEVIDAWKSVLNSKTLDGLKRRANDDWLWIADDAVTLIQSMDEVGFKKFKESIEKENKGIYSEDDVCGTIMLPKKMLKVSMMAERFICTWGLAYIRLKDTGKL